MSACSRIDIEKEETTEDDEDTLQPPASSATYADSDEQNAEEDTEDEDDQDSDDTVELPEMLVPNRQRRTNAGTKMKELIKSAAIADDDFYNTTYGGFGEEDHDDNFVSPDSSGDEVDSDFDIPEDETQDDECMAENETLEETDTKRAKRKLVEKCKVWAAARFNRITVQENTCDPKTQQERLDEAKKTAELNLFSLRRFEEFEIERKKRNTKPTQRSVIEGPRIREIYQQDGTKIIIFPELPNFEPPKKKEFRVCAVTGLPAKYIEPCTGLPYSNSAAFKTIREGFKKFLSQQKEGSLEPQVNGINS